jgi:hypothetical protein
MALLTPPPAAPQRGDRTTFAARVDAFITWLINFVSELLALVGNLNSLAAGGAYAIPFTVAAQADIGGTGGRLACENSAQSLAAANFLLIDQTDARGALVRAIMDEMYSSGSNLSAVRGYVKLTKSGDPSQWITFRITNWSFLTNYGILSVASTSYSSINPFILGDVVTASFQRTGDKGDTGNPGTQPSIYVRYEVAAGTASETFTAATWNPRSFNTVKWNDAPASLASYAPNTISLAAGTWEIEASACAPGINAHKVRLYNVIDSVVAEVGEAAYSNSSSGSPTRSHVRTRVTVPVGTTKTYRLDHWTATGGVAQTGSGGAAIEVYSEMKATKVA